MENVIVNSLSQVENLEIIKEMVKTTPNDADLGKIVRDFITTLETKI